MSVHITCQFSNFEMCFLSTEFQTMVLSWVLQMKRAQVLWSLVLSSLWRFPSQLPFPGISFRLFSIKICVRYSFLLIYCPSKDDKFERPLTVLVRFGFLMHCTPLKMNEMNKHVETAIASLLVSLLQTHRLTNLIKCVPHIKLQLVRKSYVKQWYDNVLHVQCICKICSQCKLKFLTM